MEIRTAKRTKAKLRIGLQGPSGSGKTYSALLLAYGITQDWSNITVIDTENNSADLYAHLGPYNVLSLKQPYTPEQYIKAIEIAELAFLAKLANHADINNVAGVASQNHATNATIARIASPNDKHHVIIIDSISHEWEGPGGILDIHTNLPGNSFTNWGKLTPRHNALIEKILNCKTHVICTIRSKQDYVLSEKNGKMVPGKVGLKGVTREGFDYELTLLLELDIKNNATSSKDRTGLFTGKPEFKINSIIGKKLLDWSNSTSNTDEVKEKILKSQSLEELIGIYNQNPEMHENLKNEFILKKKQFTSNTSNT